MRIWMTTETEATNGILGYVDVYPDDAGQFLIDHGYAVDAKEADNLPDPADGKQAVWAGSQATKAAGPAPTIVIRPVISGDGSSVGATLTCQAGAYYGTPAPTVTRVWQRDGVSIDGQNGLTYLTIGDDAGTSITVLEDATNSEGSITATSNALAIT